MPRSSPRTVVNKYILVDFDVRGQQEIFSLEEAFFIIIDCLMSRCHIDGFVSYKQFFTSQELNWWTGVMWITCGLLWCFYQLFGHSFWRHPFTAEDPLLSNGSPAILHFSKSVLMKKQTHLLLGWPEENTFSGIIHFWVNYFFKDLIVFIPERESETG